MPDRSRKTPKDANKLAKSIVDRVTGPSKTDAVAPAKTAAKKNPAAVALGRRGGLKGGRARAESMTAEERSAIAKVAAQARWSAKLGKDG